MPKISVVMSVYNGEKYVHDSVESIIHQSERDIEFIIINDGSTDKSLEILREFQKKIPGYVLYLEKIEVSFHLLMKVLALRKGSILLVWMLTIFLMKRDLRSSMII